MVKRKNLEIVLGMFSDPKEELTKRQIVERMPLRPDDHACSEATVDRALNQLHLEGYLHKHHTTGLLGRPVAVYKRVGRGSLPKDVTQDVLGLLTALPTRHAGAGALGQIAQLILDEEGIIDDQKVQLALWDAVSESQNPMTKDRILWITLLLVWRFPSLRDWIRSESKKVLNMGAKGHLLQTGILLGLSADPTTIEWLFMKLGEGTANRSLLSKPNMMRTAALFSLGMAGRSGKGHEVRKGCVLALREAGGDQIHSRAVNWIFKLLDPGFREQVLPDLSPSVSLYGLAYAPNLKQIRLPEDLARAVDVGICLILALLWERSPYSSFGLRVYSVEEQMMSFSLWYSGAVYRIDTS